MKRFVFLALMICGAISTAKLSADDGDVEISMAPACRISLPGAICSARTCFVGFPPCRNDPNTGLCGC